MAKLTKTILTTYIPGNPGSPGSAGTAPSPGYWVKNCTTVTAGCITQAQPIYGACPTGTGNLVIGTGTCVIAYQKTTTCWDAKTTCTSTYVPPSAGTTAVPATPPTPSQTIQNFQEGWNASAQSIVSLLPGKAALFRLQNGARAILLGFAAEQWLPRVNDLAFGVMFSDGKAEVYENGVFKEFLGYFSNSQEFIIGRTLDNYIMYINKTTGEAIARRRNPAAPTVSVHLFSMLYRGGDTVLI
jgi:hypothetical protein